MPEWDAYTISTPGSPNDCSAGREFHDVRHIAHLRQSRRILEDGYLRAGLVNDGSRLDASRTCVNFLSANAWADGSIYGNVEWTYDWDLLVRAKNLYWVEARTGYSHPICRFLISDRAASAFPGLTPYHPAKSNGPIGLLNGKWFRNADVVSEFLYEGDLQIDACAGFDFVNHHSDLCRNGGSCEDKKLPHFWAAAQTMAFVFGNEIRSLDAIMQRDRRFGAGLLHNVVEDGLGQFYLRLTMKKSENQGTVEDAAEAVALVRGAMALFGTGQVGRARDLTQRLKVETVLRAAIETIVDQHFGIEGWSLFEGEPALKR